MTDDVFGPGFPDVSEQVRKVLHEDGFTLPEDEIPHLSIPTRVWLSPLAVAYGYLEARIGDDPDAPWEMTFRQAPLTERPRYEFRLGPAKGPEVAE